MRYVMTALIVGLALLVVLSFFRQEPPKTPDENTPAAAQTAAEPTPETTDTQESQVPAQTETAKAPSAPAKEADDTSTTTEAPAPAQAVSELTIDTEGAAAAPMASLGSTDPKSPFFMKVDLSRYGAGIRKVTLSRYQEHVTGNEPYIVFESGDVQVADHEKPAIAYIPFAAIRVIVDGTSYDLQSSAWSLEAAPSESDPTSATYALTLTDNAGQGVLKITRRFMLAHETYDLRCYQTLTNLTAGEIAAPLKVTFEQYAQGDAASDSTAYLGDQRKIAAGYHNLDRDPQRIHIYTKGTYLARKNVLAKAAKDRLNDATRWIGPDGAFRDPTGQPIYRFARDNAEPLWPNADLPAKRDLVWLATMNRYFAVAVHGIVPEQFDPAQGQLPVLDDSFTGVGLVLATNPKHDEASTALALTLRSPALTLESGQARELNLAIYAGPKESEIFDQPPYQYMAFDELIRYELGCIWCTFQWLAHFLLGFLKVNHMIFRDWGIAIVILVVVIRLILHPITKRAQINMMKMGKQMQAMKPELDKLKKKYEDDPKRYQQEQMKLMREQGMSAAGILGCLPMFLQTPIWIALYAMLYFAIELRQQPAFYDIFHGISTLFGGHWDFLRDLSRPDRFIVLFDEPRVLHMFFVLDYSSINILPILMAVVFFIQQTLTTPPTADEKQQQQQKIMRFMTLLFPLFLYSAPSGLTLYMMVSSAAGILDSYIVRKHIREQEEQGKLFEKKEKKPGCGCLPGAFGERLQRAMEDKQKQMQVMQEARNREARQKQRRRQSR